MSNEEYREYIRRMLEDIDSESDLKKIFEYTQWKFLNQEGGSK